MSPGSADRQRHSCRTRMIDIGRLRLPHWTRMCCCQARAGVRLWPSQLARRHTQRRRVRRGTGHAARGPATPRRFCRRTRQQRRIRREGRLAGAAQLRLLLVGGLVLLVGDQFEPCRSVSSGDAFEHGEVAHEVSGGGAVPVFLAWRGVYFRPGKGRAARCRPAWWRSGCRGRCLDKCRRSGLRRCSHARWRRSGNSRRRGSRCRGRAARRARRRRRRR